VSRTKPVRAAGVLLAVATATAVASITGCSPRLADAAPAAPIATIFSDAATRSPGFFVLDDGSFTNVDPASLPVRTSFELWTVQARVPFAVSQAGTTYLAVNGWGVATLGHDSDGEPDFVYHRDRSLFSGRTITRLLAGRYGIFVHAYFNSLLNDRPRTQLPGPDFSLVSVDPASGAFSPLAVPLQEQEPGWEPVSLVPVGDDRFYVEWKHTDEQRADFRYSRVDLTGMGLRERVVDQARFLEAYGFRAPSDPAVSPDLRRFVAAIVAEIQESPEDGARVIDVIVRTAGSEQESRIRYVPDLKGDAQEEAVILVPVVRRQSVYYALLPGSQLLRLDAESVSEPRHLALPTLPPDHWYTDLFAGDQDLVIAWEQVDFVRVASAGIYLIPVL